MANQSTKAWYWEYGAIAIVCAVGYVLGIIHILKG